MHVTDVSHCVFNDVAVFLAPEIQPNRGTRAPVHHAAVCTHLPLPVVTSQRG